MKLEVESLHYHAGPPAAARVVIRRTSVEGISDTVAITLGDAIPVDEAELAALDPGDAAKIRAADRRGDRASRFLAGVLQARFAEKVLDDLLVGGELAAPSGPKGAFGPA
jgi:hypothetical protein